LGNDVIGPLARFRVLSVLLPVPRGHGSTALAIRAYLPKQHDVEIEPPATLPTQLSERDRHCRRMAAVRRLTGGPPGLALLVVSAG
jgi:hypothetical protein